MTTTRTALTGRTLTLARLAGVAAAGVALGVGELVSGLGTQSQSLVGSVGGEVIDQSPGSLVRTGIVTRAARTPPDRALHPRQLHGGTMVRRAYAQRSVFEVLLPDGHKLWTDEFRAIDGLLDDDALVDLVDAALRRRHPLSGRRGRLGTPATVVLRMLMLKHLRDWSFDECEREVRGSLVHRAFCRIDCERVPDAKTLIRLAHLIGPETLKPALDRIVQLARQRGVTRGQRMRVDTTVVETDIHYPTDASLLGDGVRVLTRTMRRIADLVGDAGTKVRDRTRSTRRCLVQIGRASRSRGEQGKQRMWQCYRRLMAIAGRVVGQARRFVREVSEGIKRSRRLLEQAAIEGHCQYLVSMIARVQQVLRQTRERIDKGNTHAPDKIVSLFEPDTEVIRKGKAGKPTEFGKMVKIQEAEQQIVTHYEVYDRRPSHVVHPSWPFRPSFNAGTSSCFRCSRTSQSSSRHR